MPPALDRHNFAATSKCNPFDEAAPDDNILLTNEDEDRLLCMDDLKIDDDDNLLLNNDEYNDNFVWEFSQIEDKFQKSQVVMHSSPMVVVEAEREEDEEEKKVASKDNH